MDCQTNRNLRCFSTMPLTLIIPFLRPFLVLSYWAVLLRTLVLNNKRNCALLQDVSQQGLGVNIQ